MIQKANTTKNQLQRKDRRGAAARWAALGLAALLPAFTPAFLAPASSAAAGSNPGAKPFPTIPEADWVGLRLMILPQSKALQHYGYQELYQDPSGSSKNAGSDYAPLRYEDYAGRIVRVVGIGRGHLPNGDFVDEADLQLEGDKKMIHGDIDHGCMTDTASVSDLETARALYQGKTLWLAADHLSTYDPQKDAADVPASSARQEAFGKIAVKQYSPVKVLDIKSGWYASAPTRFVVQEESGQEGYVDVHMSDTNIPKNLQGLNRFEGTFLTADPRLTYPWPAKVWAALENKQVFLGMTASQVRMSWGPPQETHSVAGQAETEQWVYEAAHMLTLKDGVLTEVSGTPAAPQN